MTPERRIVLVTLSYARGWRLPGGGRKPEEEAEEAVLRELREEIGLISHGAVTKVTEFSHRPDFRNDRSSLLVVADVRYRPRWSLEVKAVREFELGRLPPETAPVTRRLIAAASDTISAARQA